ncbi:tenascin-like [Zophobas morio]|uniref:tenascin-like n=1 Tax=Zophobas morio TaxID=2755281 RepID=UPI003083AA51
MLIEYLIILTFTFSTASGSGLHGPCEGNEQCGTLDTYCKNGICVCKDDFVVFYDHCVQLATPHIQCMHKSNCIAILGQKGFCKSHKCVCKSFHHFYNNQCIKSKGLDEQCDNDHQCYCGQDCNDKIECAKGICACKYGFKVYRRRCIPDGNVTNVISSLPSLPSSICNLKPDSTSRLLPMIFFIIKFWHL